MEVIGEFICQHIGALIVLVPAFLYLAVLSWKYYQECKFDSMWDGKPWDEAEYQRRVKEWEEELEKKRESERFVPLFRNLFCMFHAIWFKEQAQRKKDNQG